VQETQKLRVIGRPRFGLESEDAEDLVRPGEPARIDLPDPVAQSRHLLGGRQFGLAALQGTLGSLPLGDVAHHGLQERTLGKIHAAQQDLARKGAAIETPAEPFVGHRALGQRLRGVGFGSFPGRPAIGLEFRRAVARVPPDQTLGRPGPEERHAGRVAVDDRALVVQQDRIAGGIENRLVLGQRPFAEQVFGDVLDRDHRTLHIPLAVEKRRCVVTREEWTAVDPAEGVRADLKRSAGDHCPVDRAIHHGVTDAVLVAVAGQRMAVPSEDRFGRRESEQTGGGPVQKGEASFQVDAEDPGREILQQQPRQIGIGQCAACRSHGMAFRTGHDLSR